MPSDQLPSPFPGLARPPSPEAPRSVAQAVTLVSPGSRPDDPGRRTGAPRTEGASSSSVTLSPPLVTVDSPSAPSASPPSAAVEPARTRVDGAPRPRMSVEARRNELEALPPFPFSVAEARERGVDPRLTRSPVLCRPSHGWRSRAPLTFEDRCRHALRMAPLGSAISHESAARLHEMWLPAEAPDDAPVHIVRPTASTRLRRAEIVEHRGVERRRVEDVRGIVVTTSAETWADLAGRLALFDLVAAGDSVARHLGDDSRPGAGLRVLHEVVARRGRHRHRTRLAEAIALVREGSGSRMESLVRLHMLDAGLPVPRLNAPIHDTAHTWVATVDFLWPRQRVIVEYQGRAFHTGERRDADEVRRQQLQWLGYDVIFATSGMFATSASRHAFLDRLASALGV